MDIKNFYDEEEIFNVEIYTKKMEMEKEPIQLTTTTTTTTTIFKYLKTSILL